MESCIIWKRIAITKWQSKIKGKEGIVFYPYSKNICSDRIIINIKYERGWDL